MSSPWMDTPDGEGDWLLKNPSGHVRVVQVYLDEKAKPHPRLRVGMLDVEDYYHYRWARVIVPPERGLVESILAIKEVESHLEVEWDCAIDRAAEEARSWLAGE